ncbi:hypothetical protein EVAR_50969_1 [Eumeta japonica]|uniref:Uncharacterized protein n=1 Tax=Eumeta variegata TaxID=151549 RepID=A0A4C1XEI7_EUMVA|nr:hypothetical protein EVAR_50969_1 [Eumeta japonica]
MFSLRSPATAVMSPAHLARALVTFAGSKATKGSGQFWKCIKLYDIHQVQGFQTFRYICNTFYTWLIPISDTEYKVKLVHLGDCKLLENKVDRQNYIAHHMGAKKVSRSNVVLFGNFTIPKRLGPIMHEIRVFQVQRNNARYLEFNLEKLTCHNPFIEQILNFVNVRYDDDCYAFPGNYTVEHFSLDDLNAVLSTATLETGRYAFDVDFKSNKGTLVCITLVVDMALMKKSSKK